MVRRTKKPWISEREYKRIMRNPPKIVEWCVFSFPLEGKSRTQVVSGCFESKEKAREVAEKKRAATKKANEKLIARGRKPRKIGVRVRKREVIDPKWEHYYGYR